MGGHDHDFIDEDDAPKSPLEQVLALLQMAAIYAEDGAPFTAADRAEAAARKLREIGEARNAFLQGMGAA